MASNYMNDKGHLKPYHDSTDDEAWSYMAFREARKRYWKKHPFAEGGNGVIVFWDIFKYPKTKDDWEGQVQYWHETIERLEKGER